MTNMKKKEIELKNFFIFNSTLGPKEGEEQKRILYYYPSDTNVETQKMTVGFSEAIVKFISTFAIDDCEALHTQKTRRVYFQPEKDYWIVMTINVPYVQKTSTNGELFTEYHGEQVQVKVIKSIMMAAYHMYRLFMGTFNELPVNVLKTKLESFFYPYLMQMNLQHADILDVFQGVQYLPLDRLPFFKVQCFINLVEANFPVIKHTSFLYNDQLLWSGISPKDMSVIYKYLVESLLPEHQEKELQGGPHVTAQHFGCYVSPPGGFKQDSDLSKIIKVHLNYDKDVETYYLLVYRALTATMCFFIKDDTTFTLDFVKDLDAFVSPQLSSIASDITEHLSKKKDFSPNKDHSECSNAKYVYFNQLNLAYQSTVHTNNKRSGNILIDQDVSRLVTDINIERESLSKYGEVVIKTIKDYWVIGKMSNQREFYVIIQHKNGTLRDINEEVQKICQTKLENIFFYPA